MGSRSDRGQERACTWTPAALEWPWDPDHPGYRFPGRGTPLKRCLVLPIDLHLASSVTNLYLKGIIALLLCIRPGLHTSYSPKFGPYQRPVSSLPKQSRHLFSSIQPFPTQPTNLTLTCLDRSPSHSPPDHTTVDRLVLSTCSLEPPTRPASASDCMFPCLYSQLDI